MTFSTYLEANAHREQREAEMGKLKFRSTDEYRTLHTEMQRLWKAEGRKRPTRQTIVRKICLHA